MKRNVHLLFVLVLLVAGVASAEEKSEGPAEAVGEAAEKAAEVVGEVAGDAASAAAERTKEAVFSFGDDLTTFPQRFWTDVKSLPTIRNFVILGAAGGLSAISANHWDDDVAEEVRRDPRRIGGETNHFLDNAGQTYTLLGGAAAVYGASLFLDNEPLHEASLDFLHAAVIQMPVTQLMKMAVDTERPNGDDQGFPSGHVAASFTFASVVHENFGLVPGLLGYTFGTLVALHRIDAAEHDLSDTIFGAALGYVIGSTVAQNGDPRPGELTLLPFVDSRSAARGLALELQF